MDIQNSSSSNVKGLAYLFQCKPFIKGK